MSVTNPSWKSLTIQSPGGVSFSIPLAGPMSRFLAWAIDAGIIMVFIYIVTMLVMLIGLVLSDLAIGIYIASIFFSTLVYGIGLEWFWRGQTIGKRVLKLRVVDEQGLKLRFEQVVLRNLLRVIDRMPLLYLVGGVACVLSKRSQRLGDLAAGTIVTYMPETAVPDVQSVMGDKYNSFRNHPHLEARLRQTTPPLAAALALDAIARRDALDPDERLSLFAQYAEYFRSLVSFPAEDTLGITDEQYVRNAIDSLYNTRADKRRATAS